MPGDIQSQRIICESSQSMMQARWLLSCQWTCPNHPIQRSPSGPPQAHCLSHIVGRWSKREEFTHRSSAIKKHWTSYTHLVSPGTQEDKDGGKEKVIFYDTQNEKKVQWPIEKQLCWVTGTDISYCQLRGGLYEVVFENRHLSGDRLLASGVWVTRYSANSLGSNPINWARQLIKNVKRKTKGL